MILMPCPLVPNFDFKFDFYLRPEDIMTQPFIRSTVLATALAVLFLISSTATAQSSGISVKGSAESSEQAELMRMSVKIEAQGSDLNAAMESLLEKKKKATISIEKLEPLEGTIKFGDIGDGGGQGDTTRVMQQMKRRFGDDPKMAQMMKVKPTVKLTLSITADWKLETAEPGELMLACDALKQKISKTDFVGESEDKLSPEQQELAEEMSEMMDQYGGGEESTPSGTPSFYYVRVISAELQEELLGKAFDDAKKEAMRLAKATKSTLGDLIHLSTSTGGGSSNPYEDYYRSQAQSLSPKANTLEGGAIETVSQKPDKAKYSVSISAMFGIKQ